ncbi:MAG TPA: phosphoesterase, partial [Isosphaeraceae bacterium]|nr:phosphoesterase [Isosphaeraceae bacterium]
VQVQSPGHLRLVGLINDDQTPVGQVHLGVVHLFDLERPEVLPLEDGLADSAFEPIEQVWRNRDQFESWSRICIESVLGPPKT